MRLHQPPGIAAPRHPAEPAPVDEAVVRQRVEDAVEEDAEADPRSGLPCLRAQDHRAAGREHRGAHRSEEHTSELQSLMRISYAVFCLKKKKHTTTNTK